MTGRAARAVGKFVRRFRLVSLLAWIAFAAGVNVAVPQLETVIAGSTTPVVPESAPSFQALLTMDKAFGGAGAKSVAFVVLVNENGLSQADQDYYGNLVGTLRADHTHVAGVQDFVSVPELKTALASEDGKAIYIPVGLRGAAGSAAAAEDIGFLRTSAAVGRPADLVVSVTGATATISDLFVAVEANIAPITLITVVLIAVILLVIYRSAITAAIALATIGVALAVARGVSAFFGLHVFDVSTVTASFLTAVVLGAGTDYGVFLISRYHELRRNGVAPQEAVRTAAAKVKHVIIASALTVAGASACMAFAEVGVLRTTGPAIAVSVLITSVTALTLTPALLGIAARFGWAEPPRTRTGRFWPVVGTTVVRRPGVVLLTGLLVLGGLAALYPFQRTNFDERAMQPATTESNVGYRALADHFPANEVLPGYLILAADHDLRNPRDLAALEHAAASVAKVPGVATVRGVTRPFGTPLDAASLGRQVGEVGQQLADAGKQVEASKEGAGKLSGGAAQVAEGADRLADGARKGLTGLDEIINGLQAGGKGLADLESGAAQGHDGATKLAGGAQQLATALRTAHDQTAVAVEGLRMASEALAGDVLCGLDPICAQVRQGIDEIYRAERDQLLPGLLKAAEGADALAKGGTDLASGLLQIQNGIVAAHTGVDQLATAQQRLKDGLGQLADGADKVADGANRVSDGSKEAGQSAQQFTEGLERAASFLLTTSKEAGDPAIGGFYLPAGAIDDPRLALARNYYLSADGRTARLMVLDSTDPFGAESAERVDVLKDTVAMALRGTSMENSQVLATGPAAVNADADRLIEQDFALVALIALACVLLILVLLLRSIVAPLYVLLSVVLSYAAAIGLSVLVWQELIGVDLEWTVPVITFVVLVAVGADYNILLMTRISEEAANGDREGIRRAVVLTGGVITSAGVIFAASFLAMLSADVVSLAQAGFTIAAGLLLDTFVVRTLVVPSIATLLGRHSWWPSKAGRGEPTAHDDAVVPSAT
ncbi:MMPL family transporter [Saccharothrix deserti]|uniref:MMPL family transporter n=1 Tax=Saccharothrix deserti TaxID=2593674 RepID=UPI001EE41B70|nr:MMPL family transporter [Saccharothrix deserti]